MFIIITVSFNVQAVPKTTVVLVSVYSVVSSNKPFLNTKTSPTMCVTENVVCAAVA